MTTDDPRLDADIVDCLAEQIEWSLDLSRAAREFPPHDGVDILEAAKAAIERQQQTARMRDQDIRNLRTTIETQAVYFVDEVYPARQGEEDYKQACMEAGVDWTTEAAVAIRDLDARITGLMALMRKHQRLIKMNDDTYQVCGTGYIPDADLVEQIKVSDVD